MLKQVQHDTRDYLLRLMVNAKIPPQSIASEQSVLGAILIDKNAIVEVAGFLRPEHFYEDRHGMIFNAMLGLYEERRPIDLLTLTEKLKSDKKYKEVGGSAYLTELTGIVPTSANIEEYGKMIRELYAKRELISASAELAEMSFDSGKNLRDVLDKAESRIFSISQDNLERNFVSMRDILASSFDRLDEIQKRGSGMSGIPTGYKDLDNVLAGMQDSNLLILAARPGVGKTAFLLNVLHNVAVKQNIPVAMFSLEMSVEELGNRMLVLQSGIDAWKLKTGKLEDEDFDKLQDAMGILAEAPIYIDDTPGISIMEMRTKARRVQMEHGLKVLFVDYLQLMDPGRKMENRVQEVSMVSQALKNLARELKIPVIAASQLNRSVEARGSKKPQLSDLRESGCLTGETLITLATTGESVSLTSLVSSKPFFVLALDENLKIKKYLVNKVFPSGTKKVFKLKLRSGREIRASANHKFKTIFDWKRLDQLKSGNRLAVPRQLNFQLKNKYSRDKLLLLAHLIGDGCYANRQPIHYTSGSLVNIKAVADAAQKGFAIKGKIVKQENWWHVYLTNNGKNPLIDWFRNLDIFGQHSYEKNIPQFVFTLDNRDIAFFLSHLWATDGNLSKATEGGMAIYYSTTSKLMAGQVRHFLLRLGILTQTRLHKKKGYRDGYIVDISGKTNQLIFLKTVGVFGKETEVKKAVSLLEKLEANPNLDVIPKEIWQEIEKLRQGKKLSTREFHKLLGWAYSGTQRYNNGISRERLKHILEVVPNDFLKNLTNSDVYWDEILEIIPDGEEEVFDMTVARAHNFIANDIIVHNSIEQDADVVMFLYRSDESKDTAPTDKLPTTLSIDKHRNGALREIPFMFNGPLMQFRLSTKV